MPLMPMSQMQPMSRQRHLYLPLLLVLIVLILVVLVALGNDEDKRRVDARYGHAPDIFSIGSDICTTTDTCNINIMMIGK